MARYSQTVQFFIVHKDSAQELDGKYSSFGRLIEGYDLLEELANTPDRYDTWKV